METNELKEKANNLLKKLIDISLYILGIIVAFVIGFYSNQLSDYYASKSNKLTSPHTSDNISVAVTEHNELLIIDKQTQSIEVYSDTVGIMIFKSYANRITENLK